MRMTGYVMLYVPAVLLGILFTTFTPCSSQRLICPALNCALDCVYQKDTQGCDMCECANTLCEPLTNCTDRCLYYAQDSDGCNTCECQIPCQETLCENGDVCVLLQVQCPRAPCPPLDSCVELKADMCSYDICHNGGTCRNGMDVTASFTCECPRGFTGTYCQNAVNKPGICPGISDREHVTCYRECDFDYECKDIDQKCCPTGCGASCMNLNPSNHKMGFCPDIPDDSKIDCAVDIMPITQAANCTEDDDCRGNAKCCSNGCGHVCKPAIFTMTDGPNSCTGANLCQNGGSCYRHNGRYGCYCPHESMGQWCENDGDDPCNETRCENGDVCVLLQVQCPRAPCPPLVSCVELKADMCTYDICHNGGICRNGMDVTASFTCECHHGFTGTYCQNAVNKPGICPGISDREHVTCYRGCDFDYECTDIDQKCCPTGCGTSCMHLTPSNHKMGFCPDISDDTMRDCTVDIMSITQAANCTDDDDCRGNDKCCSNGCGHVCKPAIFTMTDGPNSCTGANLCQNGGSCYRHNGRYGCYCPHENMGQWCENGEPCNNEKQCGNGDVCVLLQVQCLRAPCTPLVSCVELKADMCSYDICHNGGICRNGMGLTASFTCECPRGFTGTYCQITDTHAGVCPVVDARNMITQLLNSSSCDYLCTSDTDCPKSDKCCSFGCGTQCRPAILTDFTACEVMQYETQELLRLFTNLSLVESISIGTLLNTSNGIDQITNILHLVGVNTSGIDSLIHVVADLSIGELFREFVNEISVMFTTCSPDGTFSPIQCLQCGALTKHCFCVDELTGDRFGPLIDVPDGADAMSEVICKDMSYCEQYGIHCEHGGSCRSMGADSFVCQCLTGYTGQYCELDMDYSDRNPCMDNPCDDGEECLYIHVCYTEHSCHYSYKCERHHAGVCPEMNIKDVVSGEQGHCEYECRNDSDCSLREKCCSRGCGMQCVNAIHRDASKCEVDAYNAMTLANELLYSTKVDIPLIDLFNMLENTSQLDQLFQFIGADWREIEQALDVFGHLTVGEIFTAFAAEATVIMPECTLDGYYANVQCMHCFNGSILSCFCVDGETGDRYGHEVPLTHLEFAYEWCEGELF